MTSARLMQPKVWILIALCSLTAASGRQLLQSVYSPDDYPINSAETLMWNLHLFVNQSSADLGFIQYVNTSSGLDVVLEKVVDWQIGQPGPFSLIQLAGAACAQYTITESGECNSTSAFLVDNTAAQQASDLIVPLSQLDSALSVDQPEGIVTSSICDVDCEDHMVGLNALSAYDFVLNNDADEVCDVTTTFTAYDSTSPVCQNAVQPVNSQLSTIPKASDNIPVWASEANVTWVLTFNNASAWTFDGANCMFTSIYLPEDPALVLDHLSLSLMRLSDYASIVDPEAGTADLSLAAGGIIASCHGLQCNASASQWLYAANLEADMQYVVVISHDDGLTEVPYDTSSGFVMLQAATADKCPAAAPAPAVISAPIPAAAPVLVNTPIMPPAPVEATTPAPMAIAVAIAPAATVATNSIDGQTVETSATATSP